MTTCVIHWATVLDVDFKIDSSNSLFGFCTLSTWLLQLALVRSSTINHSTAPTCDERSSMCNSIGYQSNNESRTSYAFSCTTSTPARLLRNIWVTVSPWPLYPGIGTDSDRPAQLTMSCRELAPGLANVVSSTLVLLPVLPADLHDITDTNTFKKRLKTVLFDREYWLVITVVRRSWTVRIAAPYKSRIVLHCIVFSRLCVWDNVCCRCCREVAHQLRHGTMVQPESFTAVTIFLCDIVSFTPLAASMKPIEVS